VVWAIPASGVRGQFVLVSDQRTSSVNTELFDGVDGDFDFALESAAAFQPFDSTLTASASYAGVQSQCFAIQSSFTTSNAIAVFCDTFAELTPPGLLSCANANAQTSASVSFELSETTDVLIQVEKTSTGSSHKIQGIASFELWRDVPCPKPCDTDDDCVTMFCQGDPNPGDGVAEGVCVFDSCLLAGNQTGPCGIVMRLEAGTYTFTIGAIASALSLNGSEPNGGSASATIFGVISYLGLTQGQFTVEPINSMATLDVEVPGMPVQSYPMTLIGTVGTALGGCDEIEVTMTDFNVQPKERQIEIDLPAGGSVVVSDLSVVLGDTTPTAVLTGGAATFTNYELNVLGTVSPGPEGGVPVGEVGFAFIDVCIAFVIGPGTCNKVVTLPNGDPHLVCRHSYHFDCLEPDDFVVGATCSDAGLGGGGGVDPTLTFPSFSISGTTDLGLGKLNPTFTVSGDITASIPSAPCPWDCGDGDGNVGIVDFLALLAQWGSPGSCDFDGGGVGINDFLDLLANWGPCP
jgi:hypothetical protein